MIYAGILHADRGKGSERMGMIDISEKTNMRRKAKAQGRLLLSGATITAIKEGRVRKGDVFKIAEIAALLGVKKTPELIPHCHPIPLTSIKIDFHIEGNEIICHCCVRANYKTGVEMEALTGVAIALLTVWDTVKYLEKDEKGQYPVARIRDIQVLEKTKEGL